MDGKKNWVENCREGNEISLASHIGIKVLMNVGSWSNRVIKLELLAKEI